MPNIPIRAIFLDAGNTLFTERQPRGSHFAEVANRYRPKSSEPVSAISSEQALATMSQVLEDFPNSIGGDFRFSLAWFASYNQQVLKELGVPAEHCEKAHQELVTIFQDATTYQVFPEVPRVLEELANRGIILGVVSNWSENLHDLCVPLGLADKVDFIIASAELRSEKPDRAIFQRALFRAGVSADETLHVGDHLDRDVRGALNAGLRAALLDRSGNHGGATLDGIPVLHDLSDLLVFVTQPASATQA